MAKENRIELIKQLQKLRNGSLIICYVTSTKPNLNYSMANDAIRIIYNHLCSIPKTSKINIDLFLYSSGGVGTVPWRLVNLIREFTQNFEVFIPYKAYSAATLVALGADKIWMHPMGELGPVDPKVGNEFNPTNQKGKQIGINVEDVASYISFIKDAGIKNQKDLIQALNILSNQVHPLALGNVHRFYSQARLIGKKLLLLHTPKKEKRKINEIIDNLTAKLYYHGHPINRKEAKELGLKIHEPNRKIEDLMWELYLKYEKEMEMTVPFKPISVLNAANQDQLQINIKGVYIESQFRTDVFNSEIEIVRFAIPPGQPQQVIAKLRGQAQISILRDYWQIE